MNMQNLTVSIPVALFEMLKLRASRRNHTVEDETLDIIATAVPGSDQLPDDLSRAIEHLGLLDDSSLWLAARSHLAKEAAEELEVLNLKQQREGLTTGERQAVDALLRQYDRAMLVRAKAAAILHQRGFDVSELGPK